MIMRFWYGSDLDRKVVHWRRWEFVCKPKWDGGLGFHDFSLFNKALLAKQGWRIIHEQESLIAQVLWYKYFWNTNFLSIELSNSPLYLYRSLI